jgi:serine/threonine protein kinase
MNNGDIKIAEFGLSKNLKKEWLNIYADIEDTEESPFIEAYLNERGRHSRLEYLKYLDKKSKRSDIYSLGVVLWEISSCYPPFSQIENESIRKDYICRGFKEKPVKETPMEYLDIYTDCWNLNPPSINKILLRLQSMLSDEHDSDRKEYDVLFKFWIQKAIKGEFFTYIRWDELVEIYKVSNNNKSKETFLNIKRGCRRISTMEQQRDYQVSKFNIF